MDPTSHEYTVPQAPKAAEPVVKPPFVDTRTRSVSPWRGWYSDKDTRDYMDDIFKRDFDGFAGLLPQGSQVGEVYKQQVDALIKRSVAEEFQRPAEYVRQGPNGPETLAAEPVLMLRRAAFISRMNEKAEYNPQTATYGKPPSFAFLDLKDLYAANMAGSADWLLATVARTINNTARDYFARVEMPHNFATCRYGGDEFVIGMVGLDDLQQAELQIRVRAAISKINGYYMNPVTRQVEERPVAVNADKESLITMPEDPIDREIFTTYLNRGLILNADEVAKVRKVYPMDGEYTRKQFYEVAKKHHQDETLSERMHQIFFHDIDLATTLSLADSIDRREEAASLAQAIQKAREGGPPADPAKISHGHRKEGLVRLLDAVVLDPLLGENVLSVEGMRDVIEKGQVTHLACVDLKFIKEINDTSSMAEGDSVIEKLWTAIGMKMDQKNKSSYVFARRGGTFFVGLRKDTRDVTSAENLKHITPDFIIGTRYLHGEVPLGSSLVQLTAPQEKTQMHAWAGDMLGEAVQRAEDDWYAKTAQNIRSHPRLMSLIERVHTCVQEGTPLEVAIHETKKMVPTDIADKLTQLETLFFFGKEGLRTNQRQERILRELFANKKPAPAAA